MLVRKVALKGKNKLADKWDKQPYTIIGVPNRGVPVYKVQKEGGDNMIKTLNRNMLLPISAIPRVPDTTIPSKRPAKMPEADAEIGSACSESEESDSETVYVPKYIIPHKRNNMRSPSLEIAQGTQDSSVNISTLTEPPELISDITVSVSTNSTPNASLSNRSSHPGTNMSNTGDSTASVVSEPPQNAPRRSTRVRVPPDRYGEWLMHQNTAVDKDTMQICYV